MRTLSIGAGIAAVVLIGGLFALQSGTPEEPPAATAAPQVTRTADAAPAAPRAVNVAQQSAPARERPAPGAEQLAGGNDPAPRRSTRPGLPDDLPIPDDVARRLGFGGGTFPSQEKSAADDRPAPGWRVQPDPPEFSTTIPAEQKVEIPLPEAGVLFPTTPGTAVALGSNTFERNRREVWDMATGKKIGTIRGLSVRTAEEALSPDGRYYAAKPLGVEAIGIVDVAQEKILGQAPVSATRFTYLGFGSPTRMVAIYDESAQVWDLPELAPTRTFSPEGLDPGAVFAFSPGGRYLAIVSSGFDPVLRIYDLTTGELAGQRPAGERGCDALAFSPDGREIAGIFEQGFDAELIVWTVATGRKAEHVELNRSLADVTSGGGAHYRGRPLEWFPDGKRWLVHGHAIIDRDAGGVVWVLPKDAGSVFSRNPRGVLDEGRIAVVMPAGKAGKLMAYSLPEEQIARGTQTTRAGGLAIDVDLPPLTPADRSAARTIPKADLRASSPAWQVRPAAGPRPPASLLDEPLELNSPGGRFAAARLTSAAQPAAVVSFASFNSWGEIATPRPAPRTPPRGRARPGRKTAAEPEEDRQTSADSPPAVVLQRFDLASEEQTGTISVPFPSELLAVSPAGGLAVLQIAGLAGRHEGEGRLDLWSLDDGAHVAGWRPYKGLDERSGTQSIVDATFLDEQHLITRNFWGVTICWKLPECTAVWTTEDVKSSAVSPDRRFVALSEGWSVRILSAISGESVGQLRPAEGAHISALAWHPGGRRLAALASRSGSASLLIYDMTGGTIETEVPLPEAGDSLHWAGDNGLLIADRFYCDLEQQTVLWEYELPVGVHFPGTIDGRHWYIAARSEQDPTASLNAVELPGPHLAAALSRMKPEDAALRPGATVSVQVNVAGGPGNVTEEARRNLVERLGKANVRVVEGQPVAISLTAQQSSTGKTTKFESIGRGGVSKEVNVNQVECRVAVLYQGRTLWQQTNTITNHGLFVTGVKPENLQSHLDEQMWQHAAKVLTDVRLPKYLYRQSTPTGLGKSLFFPGGLVSAGD